MAKRPDIEAQLSRSWEFRHIGDVWWEQRVSPINRIIARQADPVVDAVFSFKRIWRILREDLGYLAGPLYLGIPVCLFGWRALRFYRHQLEIGKIRYQYKSPEHLRLPPSDIKQHAPWNSDYIAPLRRKEELSKLDIALEQSSRFYRPPIHHEKSLPSNLDDALPTLRETVSDPMQNEKKMMQLPPHQIL